MSVRRPPAAGITRRQVIGAAALGSLSAACGSGYSSPSTTTSPPGSQVPAIGPNDAPNADGLVLPPGFTSRVVARAGQPLGPGGAPMRIFPDGGACFPTTGGWYYAFNHEIGAPDGGVSCLRFAADGSIVSGISLLSGSARNCAGGASPWNTWITCEEIEGGRAIECDPEVADSGVERLAMGRFVREAVTFVESDKTVYQTEDRPDGGFYRFTPTSWGELNAGLLEVAAVNPTDGSVTWHEVPDPQAQSTPTRSQVAQMTKFNGGEGITTDGVRVWFTTKGDDKVWEYNTAESKLTEFYAGAEGKSLRGVDNAFYDSTDQLIYVAEDGGNLEVCTIDAEGFDRPFLRLVGHDGSELAGVAMNPARERLYVSSQRGPGNGTVFEISGPF